MKVWTWVICIYGGTMAVRFVSAFLQWLFDRKEWREQWREQSWEGVVIGKYKNSYHGRLHKSEVYAIEVCYDQTVQEIKGCWASLSSYLQETNWDWSFGYPVKVWKSIEIGDYVIKKSGNDSMEKRAIQEEEADEVIHVLTQQLRHERKGIRSRAAEALRQIGTPEAIEAAKEWS